MLDHFRMFADYNRWANRLIYAAAAELTDAELRENRGAFFGSLLATLNHILVADRVWMKRFTREGDAPLRSIRSCMAICRRSPPLATPRTNASLRGSTA